MKSEKSTDVALLLLRIAFGGGMIFGHGWGKLLRLFSGDPIKFADPFGLGPAASLGLATFAEFLCSVLIISGLFTRWASIPLIFTMLTAIFHSHFGDPFRDWEKAFLYLAVFIALFLTGPGWYSLDEQWRQKI